VVAYDALPYDNVLEKFDGYSKALAADDAGGFSKRLQTSLNVIADVLQEYS
jgi:hypothetical protein